MSVTGIPNCFRSTPSARPASKLSQNRDLPASTFQRQPYEPWPSATESDTAMSETSTLNVAKLKTWARTNRSLAMMVAKAMAFAQVERERVDAYVVPIFVRYGFTDSDTGETLTDPRKLYLSNDEKRCAEFYAEVAIAHRANGWDGDPEFCPALVAEDLQTKAENLLLESLGKRIGVDGFYNLDLRKRVLDLSLAVCLSEVRR